MGQYQRNGRTTEWCKNCKTVIGFKMNDTVQDADVFKLCGKCKNEHEPEPKVNVNKDLGKRNG